eukprot:SAG11_NODE_22998_length_396_cov_23.262626_1_plen_32_part_10
MTEQDLRKACEPIHFVKADKQGFQNMYRCLEY